MRLLLTTSILLALAGQTSAAEQLLCVADASKMPKSWRAPAEMSEKINQTPWSADEEKSAELAVRGGVIEIIDHMEEKPKAVELLWDDSIDAVITLTHGSMNSENIDTTVVNAGTQYLDELISISEKKWMSGPECKDIDRILPLSIYAHRLFPADDSRTATITQLANTAIENCEFWWDLFDLEGNEFPPTSKTSRVTLYDMIIWSLWIIEAELHPAIKLPNEVKAFPAQLWEFFATYNLTNASKFEKGVASTDFVETAEIATHLAFIPSGNNRHPLKIDDFPDLYRFHRENFYAVLNSGDLVLTARFMDSLRQYGCTPENDIQVRDGTRTLLSYQNQSGGKWMAYRNSDEAEVKFSDYDLVHKAWTGIMGIRNRKPGAAAADNYGGIVGKWLKR